MAVEKDKVLLAINIKFKGKSISKLSKEKLATVWAEKIDNDTEIDEYVNDKEDVVLTLITEADTRVTEAVKKITLPKTENNEGKPAEIEIDETEKMTIFEKMMLQKFNTLESKITGFETQQTQKTLTERFKSHTDLKGVPEFMFKGRIPLTEEEFENAVAELKTDYTTYATENKLASLGNDVPNNFGGGKNVLGEVKPASKEDVDKLVKSLII